MTKYYGEIAFAINEETTPGVWNPSLVRRSYYGDVLKNTSRSQSTDQVNDNINLSNRISIVSDLYINQNFSQIAYATFMGSKWKVTDVEVQFPRLILTLGGTYHGDV